MHGMHGLKCETCAVRNRALCGSLSRDELAQLNLIGRFKDLAPGEIIQSEPEGPNYFANVISGVVKLTKSLPDGRQQIVGLQFPSNFLGRPFGAASAYVAEAATDVRLCTFNRSQFESLAKSNPGLEHRLFENTLNELDSAREWMLLLGRKTATEKVASFLVMVGERTQPQGCSSAQGASSAKFELPLTRYDIADFLGLTIETVSRQLSKLKARNMIELSGPRTIIVPDLNALKHIAAQADL
jgi:CRP/FNR family transcriptional regulator